MEEQIKLCQASKDDIEQITKLYEQAKGTEFCTWVTKLLQNI